MTKKQINRQSIIKKTVAGILVLLLFISVSLLSAAKFGWYNFSQEAEDNQVDSILAVTNDTQWHYMDYGIEPGIGNVWTTEKYNSVQWKKGTGAFKNSYQPFTVNNAPTVTLQVPDGTTNNAPTYFFRTKFTVENKEAFNVIEGLVHYSDAIIIYLNGEIISAANIPAGGYATNQESHVAQKHNSVQTEKIIVTDLWALKEGENILAVELHQKDETDVDAFLYFEYLQLHRSEVQQAKPTLEYLTLQPGKNETEMGVSFLTNSSDYYTVKYLQESDYGENGKDSLSKATSVIMGRTDVSATNQFLNTAQLDRLKANTKYIYTIEKIGSNVHSDIHFFETGERKRFSFTILGDPQLGAYQANDFTRWQTSIDNAYNTVGKTDFIVSVGDQVDGIGTDAFIAKSFQDFRTPEIFKKIPIYTVRGNHEAQGIAQDIYTQQAIYPNTDKAGNNWFIYQTALIVGIDSNNNNIEYHRQFIQDAINKAKSKWVIVVMHHSIFSEWEHQNSDEIKKMRTEYADIFKDLNVDLVLSGHDHIYSRSYLMNGQIPSTDVEKTIKNEGETLYITAGSASGNKFYSREKGKTNNTAYMDISDRSFATRIDVDQNQISIKTYHTQTKELSDEYVLKK